MNDIWTDTFPTYDEWKQEILTDNSPCNKCEEAKCFMNNPYYQSDKCGACVDYARWIIKCLNKLKWLEHGGGRTHGETVRND